MIISKNGLDLIRQEEPDPQIQEILNDPSILEKLSEAHSYPFPMPSKICFRIEKDGVLMGQVCLKSIKWINHKAEISIFLRSNMRSKGYGLKALQSIIEFGFNRLNLYRMEAEIIDGNIAPLKLMERTGFTEEGRLRKAKYVNGEYRDLLRFGLLREEYEG